MKSNKGIENIIINMERGVCMNQCPFLTTLENKVECFKGCAFYELEETNEECPFKMITGLSKSNTKDFYDNYYLEDQDDIFVFDSQLEKVEYL